MASKTSVKAIRVSAGDKKFYIAAEAKCIGKDILISVWGGSKPHIGSVAVALPRPSLEDPRKTSATSSIFNFTGHKDEVIAKMFSERIAAALKRNTITTAGIHVNNLKKGDLEKIIVNCETLYFKLLNKLNKII